MGFQTEFDEFNYRGGENVLLDWLTVSNLTDGYMEIYCTIFSTSVCN